MAGRFYGQGAEADPGGAGDAGGLGMGDGLGRGMYIWFWTRGLVEGVDSWTHQKHIK